jgi:hypothetical protein
MKRLQATALAALLFVSSSLAACPNVLIPSYELPLVAPGWQAQLIANGFKKPRSIHVDSEGALLVVDSGVGVRRLTFKDEGNTCLTVTENKLLINNTGVCNFFFTVPAPSPSQY